MIAKVVTSRKCGNKPPAAVARELDRCFPEIRLWWAKDVGRWALVQIRKGHKPLLIRVLRGARGEYLRPTLANTVYHLRAWHWSNFTGWAGQRLLDTAAAGRVSGVESSIRGLERTMNTQHDYIRTLLEKGSTK